MKAHTICSCFAIQICSVNTAYGAMEIQKVRAHETKPAESVYKRG